MTCEEMIYDNNYSDSVISVVPGYVGADDIFDKACVNYINEDIAVVHTLRGDDLLTNLESVPYSSVPKLYGLMDSSNVEAVGAKRVQNSEMLNLLGQNVIVGIIDTGIDYENALFKNADGSTRIGVIWDQTIPADLNKNNTVMEGKIPVPFYGSIFDSDYINEVINGENEGILRPSKDTNGHGTFMAGMAAGGVSLKDDFTGIAPESDIAVVKLKECKNYLREYFGIPEDVPAYSETDIIYAVNYLLKYAGYKKQPISILIGIGTSFGGHGGFTYLERYLENVLKKIGIMVSAPAGNEGSERLHYKGKLDGERQQSVEINVADGQKNLVMEFWGKRPAAFGIGLVSPQGDRIERIPPRFGKEEKLKLPLSGTTIYVAYQIAEIYSGDEFAFIRLNNPTPGIWQIIVYGDGETESNYDLWLPLRQFLKKETYFLQAEIENTITSPGNAESVMTITAYNHLNGSVYANSGRGYTSRGLIKPDLAAPGVNIMGPGLRNNFVLRSGTSVAAAHSAGMLALLLEWIRDNEELGTVFTRQLQSICLKSAIRQEDVVYPNPIWGYGVMNIDQIFEEFRIIGVS